MLSPFYCSTSKLQLFYISKNKGGRKSLEEIPWPVSAGVTSLYRVESQKPR